MTENRDRRDLLAAVQQRPAGATLFCVGVGNRTDKPLLQQIADESGGIAAFLSQQDDFEWQAQAFRDTLTAPAVKDLAVQIDGVKVSDLEPRQIGNLYHGIPLRLYGRYLGTGNATVTISGTVDGLPWSQSFQAEFPKTAEKHPEIERMWAHKRIDSIQRTMNARGESPELREQIVRLGETYSIMSQHTSFIVLENDAEYQRWNIARRNANREANDREARQAVQQQLEQLRQRSLQAMAPQNEVIATPKQDTPPRQNQTPTQNPTQSSNPSNQPATTPSSPSTAPTSRPRFSGSRGGGGNMGMWAVILLAIMTWVIWQRQSPPLTTKNTAKHTQSHGQIE